jgi:trehalose/maltose hydrolase-like predicted phosphorylase
MARTEKSQEMWAITEKLFKPDRLNVNEAIYAVGNGYLSTRGAFEESYPGEMRATLVHGVFDDVPLVFTELANAPDWLPIGVYLDGEKFSLEHGTILSYERSLDLRNGLLTRRVKWVSPAGKAITLVFERFASLADEHLLYTRCRAIPEFAGTIEFRPYMNGNTDNEGFTHWRWIEQGLADGNLAYLHMRTRKTGIDLALAMRLETSFTPDRQLYFDVETIPTSSLAFTARAGVEITIEKVVGIATSRDTTDPLAMAIQHACQAPGWDQALAGHSRAWQRTWDVMDILIDGDPDAQVAIRTALYHLLIAAPRHDNRVNIGAKTLSGFGYRGHSFWDTELFMLPVFIYTAPDVARRLLNYRYQRLPRARENARQNGFLGAQFPWESADTGEEVTPTWLPHPTDRTQLVRIWTGDIEIHISADIAYAACLYWRVSGDDAWFIQQGAEIVLETARFWVSRAEWNPAHTRYEYTNVIGPDEYHDRVDNNYYTNYMARWNIKTAFEIFEWLKIHSPSKAMDLTTRLELLPDELASWQKVLDNIYLPVQPDGLIEEFEGYFQCKDVDLHSLEPRQISIQALLGIQGCAATQVLKQLDVLMLMYLLPEDFPLSQVKVNYDYYTPRTDLTFGSSLGPSIQAIITCWLGNPQAAYDYFMRAALADLLDLRGNTHDGIHGASSGGIWQAIIFGFAGLKVFPDYWETHPRLPAHWKRLRFHFYHHGELQTVDIPNL